MYLLTSSEIDASAHSAALLGGKGLGLARLISWKVPVPAFVIITASVYDIWRQTGALPAGLMDELARRLAKKTLFAVRSSLTAEDSQSASFAGMLETFLYVPFDQLEKRILDCFHSASADRVQAYEQRKKMADGRVAVVIQNMVDCLASGVAFSRSPMGNSALTTIEAGWGMGEGVVSGSVEVDRFQLSRDDCLVASRIVEKVKQLIRSEPHGLQAVAVPEEKRLQPVLTSEDLIQINRILLRLDEIMGPVDMEWGKTIDDQGQTQIVVLQARPITQDQGHLKTYADTNLSESYPGLTSPLTADFVGWVYQAAFTSSGLRYTGFSRSRVASIQDALAGLVYYTDGHLYYDLDNYYEILAAMPGGMRNIAAWHKMIGGHPTIRPRQPRDHRLRWWENLRVGLALLRLAVLHKPILQVYVDHNEARLIRFSRQLDFQRDSRGTAQCLTAFVRKNIEDIGFPVANDYMIMLVLAALQKLFDKYAFGPEVLAAHLRTRGHLESIKPLQELDRLLDQISNRDSFQQLVARQMTTLTDSCPWQEVFALWSREGFQDEADNVRTWLGHFGDRCFEELKLESPTFAESPKVFLQLLLWRLAGGERSPSLPSDRPSAQVQASLSFLDRLRLRGLCTLAHRFIAAREQTRLLRGRNYGLIRRGLRLFFSQLRSECGGKLRDLPYQSFFGISFFAIEDYGRAALSRDELERRILARQDWGEVQPDFQWPEFLWHPEGDPGATYIQTMNQQRDSTAQQAAIGGEGAAPGQTEGVALVLNNPAEAFRRRNLSDAILITKTTDPAWVFLMSQCRGLVSEKGSMLSHTAIIGRELGIPTVVGVRQATQTIKTGMRIRIDGGSGEVSLLSESEVPLL